MPQAPHLANMNKFKMCLEYLQRTPTIKKMPMSNRSSPRSPHSPLRVSWWLRWPQQRHLWWPPPSSNWMQINRAWCNRWQHLQALCRTLQPQHIKCPSKLCLLHSFPSIQSGGTCGWGRKNFGGHQWCEGRNPFTPFPNYTARNALGGIPGVATARGFTLTGGRDGTSVRGESHPISSNNMQLWMHVSHAGLMWKMGTRPKHAPHHGGVPTTKRGTSVLTPKHILMRVTMHAQRWCTRCSIQTSDGVGRSRLIILNVMMKSIFIPLWTALQLM